MLRFTAARSVRAIISGVALFAIALTAEPASVSAGTAPFSAPAAEAAPSSTPTERPDRQRQAAARAAPKARKQTAAASKRRRPRRRLTRKQRVGFRWPVRGILTSGFGRRKFLGNREPHRGQDIACSKKQKIRASKAGRVIMAERNLIYGKIVVVRHRGGYSTLYAHMSRMYVHNRQRVRAGQALGRCGSTGRSTGPHLHFEIRRNGRHLNPRPFLR